jgi:Ca-activated chloride channel homolog
VDVTLVLIPVTVTDPLNRFVTGLEKRISRCSKTRKSSKSQFSSEDAPLSVGMIFDCSGSMGHKLEKSREAVAQFFKTANPRTNSSWCSSTTRAELVQPFTQPGGDSEPPDLHPVQGPDRAARRRLSGLHQMKKAKNPRKALLIISDGGDNNSRYTERNQEPGERSGRPNLCDRNLRAEAACARRTPEEKPDPALLTEIAEQTGGRQYPKWKT